MRRLNNYMRHEVIKRLVRSLTSSMIGYEVLGEPAGRKWVLKNIASHLYSRMTKQQRARWLDK